MSDRLTYDQIVELLVDCDDEGMHWAPYQDRLIRMALQELQQRRINERVAASLNGRAICEGCGNEIDPECCGCGDSKEYHANAMWAGHSFIPMGCDCYRVKP